MIPRYSRPEMQKIWSDEARFELWLEIEILAMEAMVKCGVVPEEALLDVKQKAAFSVEKTLEIEKIVKHDVIAFLTNVAEYVGDSARFLHYGMTSSDLLDTCFSVQLTRAGDLLLDELSILMESVKKQALEHKNTVCVGRSHGIHAEPTTFGLKMASWYGELANQKRRLEFAREEMAVGAISGPVGTYAHLSPEVEEYVCESLGLKPAASSTQIIQRDHHAAFFASIAQLASTLERISVEIRHLQRTEVREAEEPFTVGQKGSSAMPHKRNPVLTENATGLARLVRSLATTSFENVALWHERDISHSSVERVMAPDATVGLHFMLGRINTVVKDLRVYPENMQKNLDMTRGLVFSGTLLVALAAKGLTREEAYSLVQEHGLKTWDTINGLTEDPDFKERVLADEKITAFLSTEEIDEVFSLDRHLGRVDFIFDRVFAQ